MHPYSNSCPCDNKWLSGFIWGRGTRVNAFTVKIEVEGTSSDLLTKLRTTLEQEGFETKDETNGLTERTSQSLKITHPEIKSWTLPQIRIRTLGSEVPKEFLDGLLDAIQEPCPDGLLVAGWNWVTDLPGILKEHGYNFIEGSGRLTIVQGRESRPATTRLPTRDTLGRKSEAPLVVDGVKPGVQANQLGATMSVLRGGLGDSNMRRKSLSDLPIYKAFDSARNQKPFRNLTTVYDSIEGESARNEAIDVVRRILEIEGPIHVDWLCRRVSETYGDYPFSPRIDKYVRGLANEFYVNGDFAALDERQYWQAEPRRTVSSSQNRGIEQISIPELASAIEFVHLKKPEIDDNELFSILTKGIFSMGMSFAAKRRLKEAKKFLIRSRSPAIQRMDATQLDSSEDKDGSRVNVYGSSEVRERTDRLLALLREKPVDEKDILDDFGSSALDVIDDLKRAYHRIVRHLAFFQGKVHVLYYAQEKDEGRQPCVTCNNSPRIMGPFCSYDCERRYLGGNRTARHQSDVGTLEGAKGVRISERRLALPAEKIVNTMSGAFVWHLGAKARKNKTLGKKDCDILIEYGRALYYKKGNAAEKDDIAEVILRKAIKDGVLDLPCTKDKQKGPCSRCRQLRLYLARKRTLAE